MNPQTEKEYATVIEQCRSLFKKKTIDYGTSWRILRLPSLTDQIYIKARRIRSIQEKGKHLVEDGVKPEFTAMVNYALMALIIIRLQEEEQPIDPEKEFTPEQVLAWYDEQAEATFSLLQKKNHDYDEAWRMMRVSSMTDLILMKLLRVKQIEDNEGQTLVSEGVAANYQDIINYSVFCLIRLEE